MTIPANPPGGEGRCTEGVCDDGAAILCDGQMMPITDILAALNAYDDMLLALSWLVGLKDQRPADYSEQKPLAWAAARAAILRAAARTKE